MIVRWFGREQGRLREQKNVFERNEHQISNKCGRKNMALTNDIMLRIMQFIKMKYMREGEIGNKSFLMLGKQEMHLHESFLDVLEESGLIDCKEKFGERELEDSVLFFLAVGFKEVRALDVSDYEKADIIFDLNYELPKELENRFDIVFDGGVIEHVFNVATAFLNICKMTKIGGYIFSINPVYNYIHNTFWNISPEMFLDFYSANEYKILDCSMITWLSEDRENRAWAERPVIWSPDVRLLNFQCGGGLCAGEYLRMLNRLCSNPHPHTWIIAQKTHSREFVYPIVSGYAKKHKGESEDYTNRTIKMRPRYDISKLIAWLKNKEKICIYCAGETFKTIMKALYENNLDSKIGKVFDSDLNKLGGSAVGKKIEYLNDNTYSEEEDILICSEQYSQEVYKQLCEKGYKSEKIFKITDDLFLKDIYH